MTKPCTHIVALAAIPVLLTLACGRPLVGAPDTSADTPDIAPDLPADPMHCGEIDADCVGPMGIGDCVDGECQGRLFSCWTTSTTCTDACAEEPGSSCAEISCDGATAYGWGGTQTDEESVELCVWADEETATPITVGCDEPLPFDDFVAIRCCCKW